MIGAPDGSLVIYAKDHSRFEQKTELTLHADNPRAHHLQATFRTEGIPLSDGALALPPLSFAVHKDVAVGMREASMAIAHDMGARPAKPATYHWCSWYYAYQNFDMKLLSECLDGLDIVRADRPFDFV